MVNGQPQERPVEVGLDDGLRVEIASGLNEGDTVVVESRAKSTSGIGLF
jgi:multidrug efflux pump subunit AcrA (membrane-fusion protein)